MKITVPADVLAYYGLAGEPWERLEKAIYRGTTCGAWIKTDDEELHVGSIVEGSDADCSPHALVYPFESDDLDKAFDAIEEETKELWHEANCHEAGCEQLGCLGCLDDCGCFVKPPIVIDGEGDYAEAEAAESDKLNPYNELDHRP